ncbi:MAG: FtsW/RodA/SpoVE family cell cycle protein, partial [Tumebacillaceae bacterium]
MNRKLRWMKDLDLFLIFVVAAICCASFLAVSSATHTMEGGSKPFVLKQVFWVLIGFSVMIWFMKIDLRLILRNLEIAYWLNVVLLIAVFFTHEVNGAHAWISLPGGVALEPSEFFKVIFVLMLAKYLANETEDEQGFRRENWKSYLLVTGYGLLGLGLILKEPELGQTLMILSALVVVLFVHVPPKWFWTSFLVGLTAIFAFYFLCFAYQDQTLHFLNGLVDKNVLAQHQFDRFKTFIHPEDDLAGDGYQVYEAKVAIGSGQLFGKGLYHGSQTQGNWVPEQQT